MTKSTKSGEWSEKAAKFRDAFFEHKRRHPEPVAEKDMTPIQRRMQSGGPGRPVTDDEQQVPPAAPNAQGEGPT